MKAKEILKLCEDEKLTSNDALALINSYFIKRFKSIGMMKDDIGNYLTFQFLDSRNEEACYLYFKNLLKNLRRQCVVKVKRKWSYGHGVLHVNLLPTVSKYPDGIFKIDIDKTGILIIRKTSQFYQSINYLLSGHEEFLTEEGIRNVYNLVDCIAKAIRLTSVE